MIRDLRIEPILNGFIVQAGCQRLAYTSVDELISDIEKYAYEIADAMLAERKRKEEK